MLNCALPSGEIYGAMRAIIMKMRKNLIAKENSVQQGNIVVTENLIKNNARRCQIRKLRALMLFRVVG